MAQGFPDFSKAIILMGKDQYGRFVPLKIDANGNLEISIPILILDGGGASATALRTIDGGTA